jgi:hypothetical protein
MGKCWLFRGRWMVTETEQAEVKTSEEWQKLCKIEVVDPDGWDRTNYSFSWGEELITRKEFERRLMRSTCKFQVDDLSNMWRDGG